MRRGVLLWATLAALLLTPGPAAADPGDELRRAQSELQQVKDQQASLQGQMDEVSSEVAGAWQNYTKATLQWQQAKLELARLQLDVQLTQQQQVETQAELQTVEQQAGRQTDALARRLRSLQQRGRVQYVDVLLGAHSFRDFLSRYTLLKAVLRHDTELIAELRTQQQQMAAQRDALAQQEVRATSLRDQAAVAAQRIEAYRTEQARTAEVWTQQKVALEREIAMKDLHSRQLADRVASLKVQTVQALGKFRLINPLDPLPDITSGFGMRESPILHKPLFHYGVDFGAGSGTRVHAVAAGVVVLAEADDVLGNLVVIQHGVDDRGRVVTTWYAHNSVLKVKAGQKVAQGDVISLSGATGWADGPHVHFELHLDKDAVDPMTYLPG